MPLVSIVVPTYNAAATVGEAVESVLGQTAGEWEFVVADDGSADATADVVARFGDPRVRLIRIPHSGLPAVARNAGIVATSSPLVAFLDADDLWYPRKLERQLAALEESAAGIVHCGADVSERGRTTPFPGAPMPAGRGAAFAVLAAGNVMFNSAVVVRRSLLEEHGLLDTDPRLRGTEDYELWLRLAPHTAIACVEEPLVLYRAHGDGLSASERRMTVGALVALEKASAHYPELVAALGREHRRYVGRLRCMHGLPDRGRPQLLAALRERPVDLWVWKWLAASLLPPRTIYALLEAKRRAAARLRPLLARASGRGAAESSSS